MLSWLYANLVTIVIAMVLVAAVALIVFKLVRDKKAGRHSCGCSGGCANCPMHGKCHK